MGGNKYFAESFADGIHIRTRSRDGAHRGGKAFEEIRNNSEQADEFSFASHQKALAAISAGKFKDETVPVEVNYVAFENGASEMEPSQSGEDYVDTDEGPRRILRSKFSGKLKPAFRRARAWWTAGNSSQ